MRPAPYHARGQQDLLNYSQLRCRALSMSSTFWNWDIKHAHHHSLALVRQRRAGAWYAEESEIGQKWWLLYLSVGCVRLFSLCASGKEAVKNSDMSCCSECATDWLVRASALSIFKWLLMLTLLTTLFVTNEDRLYIFLCNCIELQLPAHLKAFKRFLGWKVGNSQLG